MNKPAVLAAFLLVACSGQSASPEIEIADAWARAPVAGQKPAAVYLKIQNRGGPDRLLAVSSPAGTASIHSATSENGVVRMRAADALEIPANSTVALEPGSTHVMISGLNQPPQAGQGVSLELEFARSGKRQVMASVRSAGTSRAGM